MPQGNVVTCDEPATTFSPPGFMPEVDEEKCDEPAAARPTRHSSHARQRGQARTSRIRPCTCPTSSCYAHSSSASRPHAAAPRRVCGCIAACAPLGGPLFVGHPPPVKLDLPRRVRAASARVAPTAAAVSISSRSALVVRTIAKPSFQPRIAELRSSNNFIDFVCEAG